MRLLYLCGLAAVLLTPPATAQHGWYEDPDILDSNYYAAAWRNELYTDPIAIRANQDLWFHAGGHRYIRMDVCLGDTDECPPDLDDSSWETILRLGPNTREPVLWAGRPTAVGQYEVQLSYTLLSGTIIYRTFQLVIVPEAQRAFTDGAGNWMLLWQGAPGYSGLDRPFLVVEGIDGDNVNSPQHYYALGAQLFGSGRERGADVLILNFANGGRDIRQNAQVVREVIRYVNGIKSGSEKLDVAGVSMGGVAVRYALAEMEEDGVPHEVDHFVSIDAPHQGAVLDAGLIDWIYETDLGLDDEDFRSPPNLASPAGQQLLVYNRYDRSGMHEAFFNDLNALNGDGYPHLTDNVGITFGTAAPNADVGEEWLHLQITAWPDARFDIEPGSPEAQPGSLLPVETSEIGQSQAVGFNPFIFFGNKWTLPLDVTVEADRKKHPTFIPYASALDIVNGASRFDTTLVPEDPYFHDEVPPEIVEPLLEHLGYEAGSPPPPPPALAIYGPIQLREGQKGTYGVAANFCPSPTGYHWEKTYLPTGDATPSSVAPDTCDEGSTCRLTMSNSHIRLRVTVWCGPWAERTDMMVITSLPALPPPCPPGEICNGGPGTPASASDEGGEDGAALRGGTALPEALSLTAHPNPLATSTTLSVALPDAAEIRLAVYDVLGREVVRVSEGRLEAGYHSLRLDATGLPSGAYVVRLEAGSATATQRITLVR